MSIKFLLLKRLLMSEAKDKISMSMGGMQIDAAKGRKDMLKLIDGFRREGKRSRSRSASPFGVHEGPPRVGD